MRAPHPTPVRRREASGALLLDALVALLLVLLLAASLWRAQALLHEAGTAARQRTQALTLSRLELERLRATAASVPASPASSASSASSVAPPFVLTDVTTDVAADAATGDPARVRDLLVTVSWRGPSVDAHRVQLAARTQPASATHEAALMLDPQDVAIGLPNGRAAAIPADAVPSGRGSSRWRPDGLSTVAWLFDDATGAIVARCASASSTASTCEPASASVLSGFIRFSTRGRPDPATNGDAPMPLSVALAVDDVPPARVSCASAPVAAAALRYVSYTCVVADPPTGGWSGRTEIEPAGWHIGNAPGDYRVCRYSEDLDGSGAIDRNDEHPARYRAVQGTLAQQNFLVIRGEQDCPAAPPTHNDGQPNTVQHQP